MSFLFIHHKVQLKRPTRAAFLELGRRVASSFVDDGCPFPGPIFKDTAGDFTAADLIEIVQFQYAVDPPRSR